MNFLKNIFSGSDNSKPDSNINWVSLTEMEQLSEIIAISAQHPVLIFKHSSRCSVSRMVLKQFENEWNLGTKMIPYFLDLLVHRDISGQIALLFEVEHQSPQVLVIKNGKAVFNTSHSDIDAGYLKSFV